MDGEGPFRFLTNEEFLALSLEERLQYLAAAILDITRQEERPPAERVARSPASLMN